MASIPHLRPTLVGVAVVSLIAVAATVADAHGGKCDVKSWPGFQNFEAPLVAKEAPPSLPPPAHRIISPGRPIPGAPTPVSSRATPAADATARATVPNRPNVVQPTVRHEPVAPRAATGPAAPAMTGPTHVAPDIPTDPTPTPLPTPPGPPAKDVAPTTMTPGTSGRAPPPPPVLAIPDTPVLGPLFRGAPNGRSTPSTAPDQRK